MVAKARGAYGTGSHVTDSILVWMRVPALSSCTQTWISPGPQTKTDQSTASRGRSACERDDVAQIVVEAVKISGHLCPESMAKWKEG